MPREYQSVIIIGAPRSGTNMLRNVLVGLPRVDTWPCDEINYIWRHRNVRASSDAFPASYATPGVKAFIQRKFEQIASRQQCEWVVEKTCANSLRVAFVNEVCPDAKFVFIVRDGMDVVASAMRRWTADLEIRYLLDKARWVPPTDLTYYGLRYLSNRISRLFNKANQLRYWGPRLDGMDELLERHDLEEICALQWQACVTASLRDLEALPAQRVVKVRYEDLVSSPSSELARICDALSLPSTQTQRQEALKDVSAQSIGKGRAALGKERLDKLRPLIGETLSELGYD